MKKIFLDSFEQDPTGARTGPDRARGGAHGIRSRPTRAHHDGGSHQGGVRPPPPGRARPL
jgi:hypothetical protein